MKLNIVPARTGLVWVKLGIQTFFKQPIAMGGLFFMMMAAVSLIAAIPVIGSLLGLALMPMGTLGMMLATQQAHSGSFPKPAVLVAGFRGHKARVRSLLLLGVLYVVGILLIMGATWLIDDGKFARMYLVDGPLSKEAIQDPSLQSAARLALVLYIPLSLAFWHAPALVHWYGLTAGKALFFSLVACVRNVGAYTLFALLWSTIFAFTSLAIVILMTGLGMGGAAIAFMITLAMLMAAMFFSALYYTFRDSFVHGAPSDAAITPQNPQSDA